ncbi:MAG: tRNA pseudouridine(38-40) synthase TruA [Pseudomonadales bacterium]
MNDSIAQRYALGVAYDGTELHGWQRQTALPTVQGYLETALSRVADHPVTVQGSGRTDAGVHATGQVLHFDTCALRPDKAWVRGVNSQLPASVQVRWVRAVTPEFHARFSATARRYQYLFVDRDALQPLLGKHVWVCPALETGVMHTAAQRLLGEQDFSALRAAGCQSATAMRCIHRVSVSRYGAFVVLDIQANAFLLHMVRNIARALLDIGRGECDADWLSALLAGRDRTVLGATAPAAGLYLVQVQFPPALSFGEPLPAGAPPALLQVLGDLDGY